jgi:hypothetical protein
MNESQSTGTEDMLAPDTHVRWKNPYSIVATEGEGIIAGYWWSPFRKSWVYSVKTREYGILNISSEYIEVV